MRLAFFRFLVPVLLVFALAAQENKPVPATADARALSGGAAAAVAPVRFEAAADPTGALSDRFELAVPGFRGIEPALALVYHSRRGDGPLGVGWAIEGLSSVQMASDGKGVARFDGTDEFLLDGEELHPCVAGSTSPSCRFPAPGGVFEHFFTHVERYRRIGRDIFTQNWSVWLQNGTRLDYAERSLTATGQTASWLLTTVSDTSGNTVLYGYTPGGPGVARLPAEIQYGGTKITFVYTRRPYVLSHGIGDSTVVPEDRRLAAVDVQVNGSRLRAYALDYTGSDATGRYRFSPRSRSSAAMRRSTRPVSIARPARRFCRR